MNTQRGIHVNIREDRGSKWSFIIYKPRNAKNCQQLSEAGRSKIFYEWEQKQTCLGTLYGKIFHLYS